MSVCRSVGFQSGISQNRLKPAPAFSRLRTYQPPAASQPQVSNTAFAPGPHDVFRNRLLTPGEIAAVNNGLKRWWPTAVSDYHTPLPKLLASPHKSGLITALGGAAVLGLLSFLRGFNRSRLWLAAIGAGVAAVAGYFYRRQENANIISMMRHLPPGAVKRDMLADSVHQSENGRMAALRNTAIGGIISATLLSLFAT